MGTKLGDECGVTSSVAGLEVQVHTTFTKAFNNGEITTKPRSTYPSRIASPKGLVSEEPPRKEFQMVSAKVLPSLSPERMTEDVAPPILSL